MIILTIYYCISLKRITNRTTSINSISISYLNKNIVAIAFEVILHDPRSRHCCDIGITFIRRFDPIGQLCVFVVRSVGIRIAMWLIGACVSTNAVIRDRIRCMVLLSVSVVLDTRVLRRVERLVKMC